MAMRGTTLSGARRDTTTSMEALKPMNSLEAQISTPASTARRVSAIKGSDPRCLAHLRRGAGGSSFKRRRQMRQTGLRIVLFVVSGLLAGVAPPAFAACGCTTAILGTNGADSITGTAAAECIYGRDGDDYLNGADGNDCIFG